jgi:hypothetical protein
LWLGKIDLDHVQQAQCGLINAISDQQWKKKLAEWHLSKNIPRQITKFVKRKGTRRLLQGKKTDFFLGGVQMPPNRTDRHLHTTSTVEESSATGSESFMVVEDDIFPEAYRLFRHS